MKKIIALLLLLIISLSLFGCKAKKYQSSWDGFCYTFYNGHEGSKKLEYGGSGYILDILNSGAWEVGSFDCDYDFNFTTWNEEIYYHSLCGTFHDVTNGIILKVTEEQRLKVNSFLKDTESERYVWEGFYYTTSDFPIMKFQTNGTEYIVDLLDNSVWENGHLSCSCDYYFLKPRQKISYHSDCGTLHDRENGKVSKLTEEQRLKVNSFLENGELGK